MKRIFLLAAILFFSATFFSSCNKSNEIAKLIPDDAVFVSFMDSKSMLDKMPLEEIKNTAIYKEILSDSTLPEWGKAVLKNPEQSGIDLDKGFAFFVSGSADSSIHFVVMGSIKNSADFEKFNKNLDTTATIESANGAKLIALHNKVVTGWNDKTFYVVTEMQGPADLSLSDVSPGTAPSDMIGGNLKNSKKYVQDLFSLKKDKSLSKDDEFNYVMNKKGDIRVWLNNERLPSLSPSAGMLGMLKMDVLLKGARTSYLINFDKGQITFNGRGVYGKEMTELAKKYVGENISVSDFAKIPSKDIVGLMAFNFKPEGIKQLLIKIGVDGLANMFLTQVGLSLDEVLKGLNGHFIISGSDPHALPPAGMQVLNSSNLPFNLLVSIGIGDQTSFDKVLNVIKDSLGIRESSGIYYSSANKLFALGDKKEFVDTYLEGKADNTTDELKELAGHPMGFYLNIGELITVFSKGDSSHNEILQPSKNFWNKVFFTGGEFADNAIIANGRVTLKDSATNSLKQMFQYFDTIYQAVKKEDKNRSNNLDSLIIPPPMDTIGKDNAKSGSL